MIDPAKKYRDAGASPNLAEVLARAEQDITERFLGSDPELVRRLDTFARELSELRARVSKHDRPADPTPEFLATLRAHNVTRYKAGDVEIELAIPIRPLAPGSQAQCASCGEALPFHRADCDRLPLPTETQQRLDDALDHQLESRFDPPHPCPRCRKPMMWDDTDGYLRCTCGAKSPPPDGPVKAEPWLSVEPVEQPADGDAPAVEIDMEEAERLLKEQDAKRRGAAL